MIKFKYLKYAEVFELYLKRIEIQGFKSFADKTIIEFTNDVTAIVGPNGSGKSNISDAIRWVLGEQSIRYLRGSKMEDVIFSGTDKRRPLGYAEVSIIFDNKDQLLPIDYNEVSIKRRMFRSGESEYYINNNLCRLKDIRLLIMDTGIGKEGYSIIGQGRIDEILSNKPEDRRNIFEEAAGIVKYKTKKEEAERKLRNTEENLIRISDLISEINSQYIKLEIESGKASEFKKHYEELKNLEISLFIKEINKSQTKVQELNLILEDYDENIANQELTKQNLSEDIKAIQIQLNTMESKIEELRNEKLNLFTLSEKTNNRISILREKSNFSKRDLTRIVDEKERLNKLISEKDDELEDFEEKLDSEKKGLSKILEDYSKLENDLAGIEDLLSENLLKIDKNKDTTTEISNKILILKNRLVNNKEKAEEIKNNIEVSTLKLEAIQEDIKVNQSSLDKINKTIASFSHKLEADKGLLNKIDNEKNIMLKRKSDVTNRIKSVEIELEGLNSSLKLYENMEDSYQGYYKSVKNLIKAVEKNDRLRPGYIGPIANLISVDEKYEKAIDISLGSSIQNIVVENDRQAKILIEYLKDNNLGRVTFLPVNTISGSNLGLDKSLYVEYGIEGIASELVNYDSRYDKIISYLLGRIIIISNIDKAIFMSKKNGFRYKIVTLDGDVINPGGSLTGGSFKYNNINILNRKKHIKKLKGDIDSSLALKEDLYKDEGEIEIKLLAFEKEYNEISDLVRKNELELINLTNKREILYMEEKKLSENHKLRMEGIQLEVKEMESNEFRIRTDEKDLEVSMFDYDNHTNKTDEFSTDYNLNLDAREKLLREITDLKIAINSKENIIINLENQIIRAKKEKGDYNNSLLRAKNSILQLDQDTRQGKIDLEELLKLLEDLGEKQENNREELEDLSKNREELKEVYNYKHSDLENINESLIILGKDRNQSELKVSRFNFHIENITNSLKEIYELELHEALEFEVEISDISKAKAKVKQLKNLIRDLGSINISSIDDFKETKDRLEFLNKQFQDLSTSKEDLKKIIVDMEKEMKKIFSNSFKVINKNFSQVFTILFQGGKASLVFEDEEDILNCGIEIQAQPPGKRLQNINLLSGGEKSLTAVAILFAILQTKPSPFCVLDEIDASLDEANISRYTEYLKKFREETQFVLITHRKTTMEIANVLYGVTMENEGVSKLVSVKLKDYIQDTAS